MDCQQESQSDQNGLVEGKNHGLGLTAKIGHSRLRNDDKGLIVVHMPSHRKSFAFEAQSTPTLGCLKEQIKVKL